MAKTVTSVNMGIGLAREGKFDTQIPMSVRAAEISAEGTSLYQYDPKGKASSAYLALVNDILGKECVTNG